MPFIKEKETLIKWFGQMKEIESSAGDFYLQVASDARVEDEEVKKTFREIAAEEQVHTEIVQKIINIVKNNL